LNLNNRVIVLYTQSKMDQQDEAAKQKIQDEVNRDRELEKNKREAIEAAAKIFKIVSNPSFAANTTPDERHHICVEKNKGFAQAFPLVLSKMSRDLLYNETAFRRFLDKLHRDPGKGMDGFIERQADYAAFLYEELSRAQGRHVDTRKRREIWQTEHGQMYRWMRDIQKSEKRAKNEFEEESQKSLDERKKELLDFLNENDVEGESKQSIDELINQDDAYLEMLKSASDGQTPDVPTTSDLEFPTYNGYTEVQQPTEIPVGVVDALEQRAIASEKQRMNDFLQDSNLSSWKRTKKPGKKSNKH
jgi:hypothetical protein